MSSTRRLRMMLSYLFGALGAVSAVNWIANPYVVWPHRLIDAIYINQDPSTERIKVPYRVRVEQPTTLLVGSSRMVYGMPIEQGCRDGVCNAGLSGASIDEIASVVALARHDTLLKRVVWSVDFFAFNKSYRGLRDAPTRARLDGDTSLLVRDTLLSTTAFEESVTLAVAAARGRQHLPPTALLPIPWPEGVIRDTLQQLALGRPPDEPTFTRGLDEWIALYADYELAPGPLDLLRATVFQLQAVGVDVVLVLPPLHQYELEAIRQTGRWQAFQDWKRALAAIAPYWDYSGYNELAHTDWLFTRACFCHFHPVVGQVILRQVFSEDCTQCGDPAHIILKAGVHVDAASVAQHLDREDALMRANLEPGSRYAQLISRTLPQ